MEMEMSRLITALGLAVSQSQREIEQQTIRNFMEYFTAADSQASTSGAAAPLAPQSLLFCLPAAQGETQMIEVPVAALALHGGIGLERVKINLKVTPHFGDGGQVVTDLTALENGGSAEEGSHMELVFQRSEPPEGIARLYTELCKFI